MARFEKKQPGDALKLSAGDWNAMLDVAQHLATTDKLARNRDQARQFPRPTDVLKVKNVSGADRALGEVLECDLLLLDSVDPEHLWLDGITPTLARVPGVLRHPLPQNKIGELQVSGAVKARLNLTSYGHRYCEVVAGSHVLRSSDSGTIPIIWCDTSALGEDDAIVLLPPTRSGSCILVEFSIVELITATKGLATVSAVICGCGQPATDSGGRIVVHARIPCIELYVGGSGYAAWMQEPATSGSPGTCFWAIIAWCCP